MAGSTCRRRGHALQNPPCTSDLELGYRGQPGDVGENPAPSAILASAGIGLYRVDPKGKSTRATALRPDGSSEPPGRGSGSAG